MVDLDDATPEQTIAIIAAVIGVLILLAPVVPPQGALFGFVAILVLGVAMLWGVRLIRAQLAAAFESDEPEPTPEEELRQRYYDGEISTKEFEAELEDVLE